MLLVYTMHHDKNQLILILFGAIKLLIIDFTLIRVYQLVLLIK